MIERQYPMRIKLCEDIRCQARAKRYRVSHAHGQCNFRLMDNAIFQHRILFQIFMMSSGTNFLNTLYVSGNILIYKKN